MGGNMNYAIDQLRKYKKSFLLNIGIGLILSLIFVFMDLYDLGKLDYIGVFGMFGIAAFITIAIFNPILFAQYNLFISQEKIIINRGKKKTEIIINEVINYQIKLVDKKKKVYRFQVQTTKGTYFFFTGYYNIVLKILKGENVDFSIIKTDEATPLDKKKRKIFYIALGITLALAILVFILADIYHFGFSATIRYGWILLIAVPFLIISLVFHLKEKKKSLPIVISTILALVLTIFGSISAVACLQHNTRLIGDTHVERVNEIEDIAHVSLPHEVKILTFNQNNTKIESHIRILSKQEKKEFEQNLLNSNQWSTTLSKSVVKKLSINERKVDAMKYYMFYNISDDIYNPEINERIKMDYIFIGYNQIKGSLYIQQEVDAFFAPYY